MSLDSGATVKGMRPDSHLPRAGGTELRGRARWVAGAVLVLALLAGCAPGVDGRNATTIATAFLVAGQPSGYVVVEMTSDPPQDVGSRWRVKVDATFRDPANPDSYGLPLHALIDVDKATGQATMFAQG
jgi:hypothetical protein